MVIARLLTPTEIGVFSVTMVLLMFVATVRDLGAGQYLVQERELTTERIRAVWAVQLGLGLGLACVVLLASYPVALFYHEPRMRNIMLVVALNYAINPFGSLTYAWLMREMRFEKRCPHALFGGPQRGAGLDLAGLAPLWPYQPGVWSVGFYSGECTGRGVLPAQVFSVAAGRGRDQAGSGVWLEAHGKHAHHRLSGNAPELFLGKLQSLTAAGLYSRSNGLVQMFNRLFVDAVGAVCLPWFAKQTREHGSFVEPFLKSTAYVTAFGWSFCLALVCLAQPVVRLLYGHQWDQSVDLVRLLAVAMAFSVPAALCETALLSSGAVGTIARVTVFSAIQSVAFVALGASQGLLVLGITMIAATAVRAVLWLRATARHISIPLSGLLPTFAKSGAVAMTTVIGPAVALLLYGPYPEALLWPLSIGCLGGLAGFVSAVMLFNHPLRDEFFTVWARLKPSN